MGVFALAMMFGLLPTSLHVPTTGPGTQAVVIPAPGASGADNGQQSQFGAAGGGETVGSVPVATVAPGLVDLQPLPARGAPPGQARCVGRPARQTEDPLSPPCIASFKGANGGTTAPGVGPNQVLAVLYSQYAAPVDYTTAVKGTDSPFNRTAKVLLHYFQGRFQTYGRTVRVVGQKGSADPAGDARAAASSYNPFAALPIDTPHEYLLAAASSQVVTLTGTWQPAQLPAAQLEAAAPYLWSLTPDLETTQAATASYVCRQLNGGTATESPNPALRAVSRTFGLLYQGGQPRDLLVQDLATHCGVSPVEAAVNSSNDVNLALARMRSANVTSIIDLAPDYVQAFEQQAAAGGYLPEWVLDGQQGDDLQALARQHPPATWAGAIGPTWRWRAPQIIASHWYQAYREVDPSHAPDVWQGAAIYSSLMQLFTAVQMAGPSLSAQRVQQALFSRQVKSSDPFTPSGRYAPGRHAFISDFMIQRWSSSASPPGGPSGTGCYQLILNGQRYLVDGWDQGDSARASGPCDGDDVDMSGKERDQQATP